jgi:hypothetical protein
MITYPTTIAISRLVSLIANESVITWAYIKICWEVVKYFVNWMLTMDINAFNIKYNSRVIMPKYDSGFYLKS